MEKVNIFNGFFWIVPFHRHLKQLTALSTYNEHTLVWYDQASQNLSNFVESRKILHEAVVWFLGCSSIFKIGITTLNIFVGDVYHM